MEIHTKEDVLMPKMKRSPHSITSIELCSDQKCTIGKNSEKLASSDNESVKPIEMILVDETFHKRPIPHQQAKFSFGWKKTSETIVNAKVHPGNENIVNKSVESIKKVPNTVSKNVLHSVSHGQFKQNFQDLTVNFQNDGCETQTIRNVQINPDTKTDTQNHNLDSATNHFFKPSFKLQTGQTVLTENLPNPTTLENCFHNPILGAIPPMSYDYLPGQVLDSASTSTPHSYYLFPEHHPFNAPRANVLEDPVAAFEAAMEKLDRKKKERQLKERRRGSTGPEYRKRNSRSPYRRERSPTHRCRDYSPPRKRSRHYKNRDHSPVSRSPPPKRSKIGDLRDKISSDSRSPSPMRSKIGDLRDKINSDSRSPSPKGTTMGDLRDKINSNSRSPSPMLSKIGDLRDKINSDSGSPSPKRSKKGDLRDKINSDSRSPSPKRSKMGDLRDKINSGRVCKRKNQVAKSRTLQPADYSELDDNQSQGLIKSKLKTLTLGSLNSLRTTLLNELLEEPLIELLDEAQSPIQSSESKLKSLPSKVSANLVKESDTLESFESLSDQEPSKTDIVSHVIEFLIQETISKSTLSIVPVGQSFKVSPILLEDNKTSKYGESLLLQQTGESLYPILSSPLRAKSSSMYCSNVLEGKNLSELSQQILNDKIHCKLMPFVKLEWEIKKKTDISHSDVMEEDNSSNLQRIQSDEVCVYSPIVKLDWKLESQEMISLKLPEETSASELKEPISCGKDYQTISPVLWRKSQLPVPRSDMVETSNPSEDGEPLTSGLSLIRESYSGNLPISPIWSPSKSPGNVDHPLEISPSGEAVSSVHNSPIYFPENPFSAGRPLKPEVPEGSLINPNILNCGLCEKTCKRSVVLPCCLAQACNGCAVTAITKNRMCWGCQTPVKSTKEVNQDKVLREAIDWFKKNGTIKREHGESLITRRQLIIDRKEKLSKVKENPNGIARGKNKRTNAGSISNYALGRKSRNEKDNRSNKPHEKSKPVKKSGSSRRHCRMSDDNDIDPSKYQRKKTKLPDRTKSLTKMSENSTEPEELSVTTRVKRKFFEKIERLQTDQERLRLAKSEFQNPICSDPTLNLTFHGYRRRKLLVMQDENVDSFYDFYANPEVVNIGHVKKEERQMFYLKAGDTVSMPGFKKVFNMDKVKDNALGKVEDSAQEEKIVSAEEFKVLLENEFQKNNKPSKKSKGSSKNDNFRKQLSHFRAVHSEAINFLQFYKSELERRQVEEIIYLENLYKTCAVFYGKTEPVFCKSCNVNHKF